MVRVCLYLALALGLAGSADAGPCAYTLPTATYAAGTATATVGNDYVGACTIAGTPTLAANKICTYVCKGATYMVGGKRAPSSYITGQLHCGTAAEASSAIPAGDKATCAACPAQKGCGDATALTVCGDANSAYPDRHKMLKCNAAAKGYQIANNIVEPCTEDVNCKVSDKTSKICVNGKYHCTTPKDGYFTGGTTLGDVTVCPDAGTGASQYGYNPSTFDKGIKCAKADGTRDTGKLTITSCPDGSYKKVTASADDKCDACNEVGNSRCHCTKTGATECMATGSCASGYMTYVGVAGAAQTGCTIHTACTAGKLANPEGTETADNTCVDCKQIDNVPAADVSCNNLARSTVPVGGTGAASSCGKTTSLYKWTSGRDVKGDTQCDSDTCTCAVTGTGTTAGKFLNAASECTACFTVTDGTAYTCSDATAAGLLTGKCNKAVAGGSASSGTIQGSGTDGFTAGANCAACSTTLPATDCTVTQYLDQTVCTATVAGVCKTYTACTGTTWDRTGLKSAGTGAVTDFNTDQSTCIEKPTALTATGNLKDDVVLDLGGSAAAKSQIDGTLDVICIQPAADACAGTACVSAVITAPTISAVDATTGKALVTIDTSATLLASVAYKLCFIPKSKATGAAAGNSVSIGTLTLSAQKKCQAEEIERSYPSCAQTGMPANVGVANHVVSPTDITFTRKSGYADKCSIACATDEGWFTVTEATALTKQVGCKTAGGGVADFDKTMDNCATTETGYYERYDQKVISCMSAGQKAVSCTSGNVCWYTADCKTGYSKTKGNAVSDTCVSDSAASLSLTAVLLSVVAKVLLF